ncbi:hypothetical protein F2Q69_00025014 [Brassica cretica]|uniref:Uncharacterized protein n=2 Tax=Brassica cretica TaxID=69181 RepID=A0ABQ7ADZ8_BRACR|nr:hypothetical protein DY000_02058339 [Brassica cretica]KAF3539255.1 hypothetical protein F2Q69_00025014 [Brassica cretica]
MEVDVPVFVAYNLYLSLDPESFPNLMPFISSVEVLKDKPDISRWSLKYSAFGQDINSGLVLKACLEVDLKDLQPWLKA